MRRFLAALLLLTASVIPAWADLSFGVGFISTAASGPQCFAVSKGNNVLVGFSMGNLTTTAAILTFYDSTLANTSTAPTSYPFVIPSGASANQGGVSNPFTPLQLQFVTAISACITTASGNNGNSSGLLQGTVLWH